MLKLLVLASGVGISLQCANWTIVDPPIVFGKTATLGCIAAKDNSTSQRSWEGGPKFEPLVANGLSSNSSKYKEVTSINPFESMLKIFKFSENDVDCDYRCTIGRGEYRRRLSLNENEFVYRPDADLTIVETSLSEGILSSKVTLPKVYPRPICKAVFKETNISENLKANSMKNGKLFKIELILRHKIEDCRGNLLIKCWVGNEAVNVVNTLFDKCLNKSVEPVDAEKFTPVSNKQISIIGVSVAASIFILVIIAAFINIARYQSLGHVICCNLGGYNSPYSVPPLARYHRSEQTEGL